ncbi:GNAT family N-acetyltransferase [Clostridium sp.]|uniref:GNAT family N-acetyltransferase n=1 Tax=Clostridium sp. TaxID=1506 RepID=UPI0026253AC6|nr:GNAT family N-acetyltransferase [uncultured Clostridium sp.]
MATIEDIDSLVKLRIKLLNESNNNIKSYDCDQYSGVLKKFYYDNLPSGKVIALLVLINGDVVAISMICLYNITPSLYNLDGKMALLTDLYTILQYRNKGYGMDILKDIMEYVKNRGYGKVILNATEAGRKLYEKYGFKDVNGQMSFKFK